MSNIIYIIQVLEMDSMENDPITAAGIYETMGYAPDKETAEAIVQNCKKVSNWARKETPRYKYIKVIHEITSIEEADALHQRHWDRIFQNIGKDYLTEPDRSYAEDQNIL